MAIVTRRALLAVPLVAAVADTTSQPRLPIRKAVEFSMLPGNFSVLERFQLAHDCGFEQIECGTTDEPSAAQEILEASKKTNVLVHSVMNRDHWNYPLSSPDPAVLAIQPAWSVCERGLATAFLGTAGDGPARSL